MLYSGFCTDIGNSSKANKQTPIFIHHGLDDPMLPWEVAEKTFKHLKNGNR